ncbi:LOW QUALITY PROTEIN: steroid 17-alpha-hydroxylase/17,20 lyase-like [Amphiura filiformis]|uniref:LOW QUALITY PROTEIN: steroid 17-alpha-hydroxylase/17,20 lyase-like n=1 Tax=Amphiura filiformis TaxID=82378 RepID=UPI003B20D64D
MLEYIISSLNTSTILLVVASLLVYVWYRNVSRPAGFPPGPTALPVVGNIFELMKGPVHEEFNKLAKKYGDIFSIKIGNNWAVILNNLEFAKEAFLKKPVEFAGRPKNYSAEVFSQGYKDIAFATYSDTWKLHRKIGHSAIRHFASGKRLDKLVHSVLPKLSRALDEKEGKSFEPKEVLGVSVYNILATMCFGHEYSFGDPKLKYFMDFNKQLLEEFGNGVPADYVPILKYVPDKQTKKLHKMTEEFHGKLQKEVDAHKENYDPENVRDLIDSLLKEQENAIAEGSAEVDSLTDVHLLQTVNDMFQAGTDTTTTSLHWSVALMAQHPEIQEKIAEEMDRVVGRDRPPSLEDCGKLPYTEACMYEMFRYSSVTPVGFPRTTTEDTTLGNYAIPKDTWIFVNHWAIHRNEKFWDEPFKFKPEHFLDESGEVRQHPEGFLPFSFGCRVCLGEAFAKAEIFLLFSWLFQHYTFSIPPEQEGEFEIKLLPGSAATHQPDDYYIVAKKRF